jgi:hypothetical protein
MSQHPTPPPPPNTSTQYTHSYPRPHFPHSRGRGVVSLCVGSICLTSTHFPPSPHTQKLLYSTELSVIAFPFHFLLFPSFPPFILFLSISEFLFLSLIFSFPIAILFPLPYFHKCSTISFFLSFPFSAIFLPYFLPFHR